MKRYRWVGGRRIAGSPQKVGERIDSLRNRKGGVKAEAIVEDARPKTSVLHRYFTWDDTKAAAEHRLFQARNLVASVGVLIEVEEEEAIVVRAFVSTSLRSKGRSYTSIDDALSDDVARGELVAQARADLIVWTAKYNQVNELASVSARINEIVNGLAKIKRKKK